MANNTNATIEQEQIIGPTILTWADVKMQFFKSLKAKKKQKQERNFKTAIKLFLEAIGLTDNSVVGTELTEEFEAKINIFIKIEVARGISSTTYGPRVSKIRALQLFAEQNFAAELQLQALPKTFGQRLYKLITMLGLTIVGFWRTLPKGLIQYQKLRRWCKEQTLPSVRSLPLIKTIEAHLQVPPGTLHPPLYLLRGQNLKIGQSDSSNKSRATFSKPYFIWSDSLEGEFQGLYRHKTYVILPEGEERSEEGEWTSNEDGRVCSAELAKTNLQSFFGFCSLQQDNPDPYLKGSGINPEHLSLALLADKKLVEDHLEFRRLRSGLRVRLVDKSTVKSLPAHKVSRNGMWEYYDKGGKYNQGTIQILTFISSLLRPGFGYLYQHSEFSEKLGSRMTAPTWEDQCRETRVWVDKFRKRLSKMKKKGDRNKFDFGRDPKELIQWILDLPRPLFILQEMIKAMVDDLLPESAPELDRARQYRNLVLVSLLSANPLRIAMFTYMKFGEHLIRHGDGSWWLKFGKGAFKNRRSLDSDYLVRVAEELWPMLDRYKEEFHPILIGSTGSKYVFVVSATGRHKRRTGSKMDGDSLSDIIREMTELYIPGATGFRAHAFRHIIATDIIKKDPRLGFFIASKALHDKLATVEKEYIHLKTSEYFEPVNAHFSEAWSYVIGPHH